MAKSRSELSSVLHGLCKNVYFQPPTGTKITYPCIIYDLVRTDVRYADNAPYALYDEYSLKYITRDPDDPVRIQLVMLPLCSSERSYVNDNLHHYPFSLYW